MKTTTFLEKRKRFLLAMNIDSSVTPTMALGTLSGVDIDAEHVAGNDVANAALGTLSGITITETEASAANEVASVVAGASTNAAISNAESPTAINVESVELFRTSTGVSIEANDTPGKEVHAETAAHTGAQIELVSKDGAELEAAASAGSGTDIENAVNATAKDATAAAGADFSMTIAITVEQLAIKEIGTATSGCGADSAIQSEHNAAKDATAQSSTTTAAIITAYARKRKRFTAASGSDFSAAITLQRYRHSTLSEFSGKTLAEVCTNMTLERACIVLA